MTNGEMKAEIMASFGLQSVTGYDEKAYVQALLNRGVIDVLARTRCTVRCTDLGVSAGVSEYLLDHKIISIVDFGTGSERTRRNGYHYDPSFTLIRSDLLQVSPSPSEDGEIQVWAVRAPGAPLLNDDDNPSDENYGAIPPEYHDAILLYAKWWAADYVDDAASKNGEGYRAQYDARIREIKASVNKRGTARSSRSRGRHLRQVAPRGAWVS